MWLNELATTLRRHAWILAPCLLLVLLSSRFYHHDLAAIAYKARFAAAGELNVYAAVARHNPEYLPNVTYPPFTYWYMGVWVAVGHSALGLFQSLYRSDPALGPRWLGAAEAAWLRLAYLPFLLLLGTYLRRLLAALGVSAPPGRWFDAMIIYHPILIYVTFMVGHFDVIPTSFSLMGVTLLLERRVLAGMTLLAVGTLFKNFPLAFLAVGASALLTFGSRRERGRALLGLLCAAAIVGGALASVWGEALQQSYLRFAQHGRTLDAVTLPALGQTFSAKTYLLLAVVMALLSAPAFATRIAPFTRQLLRGLRAGVAPRELNWLVYLGVVAAVAAIFFDRVWWVQYVAWAVPWLVAFLFTTTSVRGTTVHWLGQGVFVFSYFVYTLVAAPDHNHYYRAIGHVEVGRGIPVPAAWPWMLVSSFFLVYLLVAAQQAWHLLLGSAPASSEQIQVDAVVVTRRWVRTSAVCFGLFVVWYWYVGSAGWTR